MQRQSEPSRLIDVVDERVEAADGCDDGTSSWTRQMRIKNEQRPTIDAVSERVDTMDRWSR